MKTFLFFLLVVIFTSCRDECKYPKRIIYFDGTEIDVDAVATFDNGFTIYWSCPDKKRYKVSSSLIKEIKGW